MTYQEATDYLFTQTPMFQSQGAGAYKPGLGTVAALSEMFGNPHMRLRTIHIGGTNGKGSTAHTIAAVLQCAGYRVGLFTSPHLLDFRERIRVNGQMISPEAVCDFVERFTDSDCGIRPSFFELTTVMAFEHFARENVDVAVIEVGLGGRLDSTNIIMPDLCVITNISLDHTALLGSTCEEIAGEKAGIIKAGIPVVIGEAEGGVRKVFESAAGLVGAPVEFAEDKPRFGSYEKTTDSIIYHGTLWGDVESELCGDCQTKNASTILCALSLLGQTGYRIDTNDVRNGFASVCELTGLAGRWMTIRHDPTVICDTGHNPGGWQYLGRRLSAFGGQLHMVVGFVNDKDISSILAMMPRDAIYNFVSPSVKRGLPAQRLASEAAASGLCGSCFDTVAEGYENALSQAKEGDTVFVGGSTFVVADLLSSIGAR